MMSQDVKEPAFRQDDHVVYPLQGVGHIQSIIELEFQGKKLPYYVIYLPVSDMTVKVPVAKAGQLGIRAIVPREEAEAALALFSEDFEPVPADWKMRYQMNLDLLKKGTAHDIATVVRTLYHRKKVKELPIMERKLYDSALQLLVDEVSFSLGIPAKEVEELVFSKLEVDFDSGLADIEDEDDDLADEELAEDEEADDDEEEGKDSARSGAVPGATEDEDEEEED